MTNAIFQKSYTRDFSIIIQESWFNSFTINLKKAIGWKNPNKVPYIFDFTSDGVVEVWENEASLKWFMDALFEKNKKDPRFLKESLAQHLKTVKILIPLWKKGYVGSIKELEEVVKMICDEMVWFLFFYFSAMDERTPKELRKFALDYRSKDLFFDNSDTLIRKSLLKIYPSLKGYETLVRREEISSIPPLSELKKRREGYIIVPGVSYEYIQFDEFVKNHKEYKFLIEKFDSSSKELKGQVAFKGKAKGIVRILRRKDQVDELKEGEIIVSPMTTPDFLAAMKKASAFVTDEGGVTCHAAIVAREFGKPCIIGTKVATKVLKDGDLVEVDANKGIVRKIK